MFLLVIHNHLFFILLVLHFPECTFIILDAEKWSSQKSTEEDCMVGDVNLFLTNSEDPTVGEIEIMIAGHLICFISSSIYFVSISFFFQAEPRRFTQAKKKR